MIFESFQVGALQCNCMILACEESRVSVVIDPGDHADTILGRLTHHRLKLAYLLHTHAHFDHIGATDTVHKCAGGVTALHEDDMFLCENLKLQTEFFGSDPLPTPTIERFLKHADTLSFGKYQLSVLHTPGHTPGSLSFYIPGIGLVTGDTLFSGSIGRTDLWGGSHPTLIRSIHKELLTFPDDTHIYPGHGPRTTIGREKQFNPYLT